MPDEVLNVRAGLLADPDYAQEYAPLTGGECQGCDKLASLAAESEWWVVAGGRAYCPECSPND